MKQSQIATTIVTLLASLAFLVSSAAAQATYKFDRMWPTLQQPWYFNGPQGVAVDRVGNMYVVDRGNARVEKFTSSGVHISQWGSYGAGDGQMWLPTGIAVDIDGFVYVADWGHNRIQKFTSGGEFLLKWGDMGSGNGQFTSVDGLAVDSKGFVYALDQALNSIQKFTSDGIFVTRWGTPGTGNGQFDFSTTYSAEQFVGIAADSSDFIYVCDWGNSRVQKFTSDGTYVAQWGTNGNGNGQFVEPGGIAVDGNGNVVVVDFSLRRIQKFTSSGAYITQWGSFGRDDGQIWWAGGIAADTTGNFYVVDQQNQCVQKFSNSGIFLSNWRSIGFGDSQFFGPTGIDLDAGGYIYVADYGNQRIQKFSPSGVYLSQWGGVSLPRHIVVDSAGYVYVTDSYALANRVVKFNSGGAVVTQWGGTGTDNGHFQQPWGIDVDSSGFVYVSDHDNHRVQKFTSDGTYVTQWGSFGSGDGQFNGPCGLAVDNSGFVYVADGNSRIQKFTSNGVYATQWGSNGTSNGQFLYPDGLAVNALGNILVIDVWRGDIQEFTNSGTYVSRIGSAGSTPGQMGYPHALAIDPFGNIGVAEEGNNRIQKFKPVTLTSTSKAVVVAAGGPFPGNNLWDATQVCANFGYRTLTYQGYTKDTIKYLSSDTQLDLDGNGVADDVDGDCTLANLQSALTTWASAPVNGLPVDNVVVYLVDHGGVGQFRMNATETLSAAQLQTWLNTLQAAIPGKLIVVYDACESGSFMSALAAPPGYETKRLVLTSTSPGESAYFVTRGTVSFSNYFWTQIFNGVSVGDAFNIANQALSQTFGYQHPLLDDTGDGAGNGAQDGALAATTFIGNGTRQYWEGPVIGAVPGNQTISGTSTATLWADPVTDTDGVARAWGVIRPPDFDQASSDNPVTGLPQVELFPTTGNRFEGIYQYFTTPGTYNILIYAMDRVGNVSAPKLTTVSVGNPLKRKAVIVAGGTASDVNWPGYEGAIRSAYDALLYQGYVDADITFMSPVTIAGVDYGSSLSNLQNVLTPAFNSNTQDVTLCLVGPGDGAGFGIASGETLTATQLDGWLDTLQGSIPGTVTLVYDAANSGSFLAGMTPPSGKRIVLSSATATQGASFLRNGSISFSKFFWGRVLNGATVYEGYSFARAAMKFAGYGQLAMLDDNADGVGSTINDGVLSRRYYIGTGVLLAGDDPIIGSIVDAQDITATSSATIWVENVTTTSVLDRVYAVIAKPDGNVVTVELTDTGGGHYAATYTGFTLFGDYGIAVYATDTQGGVSAPLETTVSRLDGPDQYEVDDTAAQATWMGAAAPDTMFQRHTFHTVTDDDWVSFDAVAGDVVTIEAFNVGANAQCSAELFASDGTTLIDQDATGLEPGGAIIEYIVPSNGSFYVRMTNLLGIAGVGTDYDLRIYKPTGPCGTDGGAIHVSVHKSGGLPLSGIEVTLTGYGLPKSHTTTTTGTVEFLGLEAATYTVSITDPDYTDVIIPSTVPVACGSSTNVTATLTPVVPPPVLQVTPTQEQSNAPANTKTFTITNAGGGTLSWTATILPGSEWLSFSGASTGTNAGSFTVQYGKNNAATARTGWVRLTAPGADGSGVEVSVKQKADTDAPTITLASASGSTVSAAITVTATLNETSTNFVAGDVTPTNAAVSGFTGSGTSYSFTLTPTYVGAFSAVVNAGVFTDPASNGNTISNVLSRTYTPTQVWVDMAYAGTEHGTQAQPFNTLAEGIASVAVSGTVKAKGNTAEHPRITKALRIIANTAPTRIGGTAGLVARNLDSDGDGLPDAWELQHGLDPKDATGVNGALGDPDNDGLTNAQELENGTEPVGADAKAMPVSTKLGLLLLVMAVAIVAIASRRDARS